jgi:hypothetical protein
MSGSPTFVNLLDDAALLSLEHQIHLSEMLGEHSWEADLAEPRFAFTGDHPVRCTAVHLVGSAAPGPRSWLWGWANPAGYPHEILALGEHVRAFGEQHGIRELASAEVPFDALPGSPEDPALVAGMMMEAAKAVSGRFTSYNGPVAGGTRAGFIVEHPEFQLPQPAGPRVMRVLQQSLVDLRLADHRRAFHSYGMRRGLTTEFVGPQLHLNAPGVSAKVSFDDLGRVSNIAGSMS